MFELHKCADLPILKLKSGPIFKANDASLKFQTFQSDFYFGSMKSLGSIWMLEFYY